MEAGATAAVATGEIPTRFSLGGSSWIAGGQLGCNYQVDSHWVIGGETDLSGTHLFAGQTISTAVPARLPLTSSVSQNLNWIGTTRGRIGTSLDNVLLYATGGAAYAHVGYTYTQNDPTVAISDADSATRLGWTAGAGLEVAFGHWSVKGEWLYYDLGGHTLAATCVAVGGSACPGATPTVFFAHYNNTGSIARIGLNYHFN
jgi:outer membrane immunogenic protein